MQVFVQSLLDGQLSTSADNTTGRNPFEASWRAHGELGHSRPGFGGDIVRLTSIKPGDVRAAFERGSNSAQRLSDVESDGKPLVETAQSPLGRDSLKQDRAEETTASRIRADAEAGNQEHYRRVAQNNLRLIAEGPPPGCETPYGMSWAHFIHAGGKRGSDGIPLSAAERSQLTSGRGLFGG
jgi:hypothetical protein